MGWILGSLSPLKNSSLSTWLRDAAASLDHMVVTWSFVMTDHETEVETVNVRMARNKVHIYEMTTSVETTSRNLLSHWNDF